MSEVYPGPPAISKTVRFVLRINGFSLLISFTNISILDVAGVLDLPIKVLEYLNCKNQK